MYVYCVVSYTFSSSTYGYISSPREKGERRCRLLFVPVLAGSSWGLVGGGREGRGDSLLPAGQAEITPITELTRGRAVWRLELSHEASLVCPVLKCTECTCARTSRYLIFLPPPFKCIHFQYQLPENYPFLTYLCSGSARITHR